MLKRFLAFLSALMQKVSNAKPRKCRKCGNRSFSVITLTNYAAQIDGRTKQVVTDSIIAEDVVSVKCNRCFTEIPKAKLDFAPVALV